MRDPNSADGGPATALARWRIVDDLFLFYGDGGFFTGEAFARWLEATTAGGFRGYLWGTGADFRLSSIDRSRGRGPFLKGKIPFATVTDSMVVRGLVTTGRWMRLNIAAFPWSKLDRAFEWLEAPPERVPALVQVVHTLRREVEADLAGRATA
jgi:hypothetical protein